ncbi:hypothetical protein P8452_23188 [Trifolium repens]|nr:hypothetical protein P8452_23188 [Trifolium repens]
MNKARFGLFFILFILLACRMVILTDGRKCESKRRWIKGNCLSDEKCAADCLVKGFLFGKCRGVDNRCYCKKPRC